MNVNLSPQLEAMVKAKVASGLYTSAIEVVREALRLMEQQDRLRSLQLQQLRSDIQEGLSSGEPTPWKPEEIRHDGRKRKVSRRDPAQGALAVALTIGLCSFPSTGQPGLGTWLRPPCSGLASGLASMALSITTL